MSFFDLFRSKKAKSRQPENLDAEEQDTEPADISADNFVSPKLHTIQNVVDEAVEESKYAKKIHQFLNSDFESIGYNDALVNPESKYKEDNIKILQSDYLLLLMVAEYAYKDYLKEIESYTTTGIKYGLEDTLVRLEARRKTIEERLKFIEEQRLDVKENTGVASRITLSYSRGFFRGMTVLIRAKIDKNV